MEPDTTAPSQHVRPRGWWAPAAVLVAALILGTWAVVQERAEISDALGSIAWWSVLLSFVAGFAGLLAIFKSWARIVADTGADVRSADALRIYGVGQVGKYVPGSVWSVLTQTQLGSTYGISRMRMASASLVALLVSVAVAVAGGCLLLPLSGETAERRFWFAPLISLVLVAVMWPPLLNRIVRVCGRILGRPVIDHAYSGRGILAAAGWAVVANLLFGLHILALGHALGLTGVRGYLLATCSYALAAGLGVIVVFAPAGAGVREAVMTIVLAPQLDVGAALTVALLSRAIATVVDFSLAMSQVRRGRARRDRAEPVFLTRRFPPSVGGMETLAAGVWRAIRSSRPDAILLAHGGSNRRLVVWLPFAVLRLTWLVARRRVAFVLTGDAPMYAVVEPILRLARIPRATMILGLDVTYENPMYRAVVLSALRRAPQVIAISNATRAAASSAGVADERLHVLRLGVDAPAVGQAERARARSALGERHGIGHDEVVLLTLGRLVRRKGVGWFVGNVLPDLPDTIQYIVAGDGPESDAIKEAAERAGVASRVHLLGSVSDEERDELMCGCDLFVQPNVPVAGDMEGFGLVTIEAAMRGAVVVASELEGIMDAVVADRTGILLPPEDRSRWSLTIAELTADRDALVATGARFQDAARDLYGEESMARGLRGLLGLDAHSRS